MNIVLKGYQENAVQSCLRGVTRGIEDWGEDATTSAVSLSATTSAGKTIMSTALIERLRFGDETRPANPNLTVLWLTNSPALNRQTMMKMLSTSTHIKSHHLVEIDDSVSGTMLDPGKIYFLHTQVLGGSTKWSKESESRSVSVEQMIRNTVNALGGDFLLVIDEAHIGTAKGENGKEKAAYRVMNGDASGYGRFPVVLGISATPKRFMAAVNQASRGTRQVSVPVEEIRDSGLIKDRILAHVPDVGEYAESKLLRAAVEKWQESDRLWSQYHEDNPTTAPVKPLLLIQVPAGIDDNHLDSLLTTMRTADPRLDGLAIAHSLGEHRDLKVKDATVKFIDPEDIQAATHIRAVLFKEALTTGWDCPRAEVMFSLRTAKDETYITQMIGRMVRTPLAQRIPGIEELNDVTLYLPLYNLKTIEGVRQALSSDAEGGVSTEFVSQPVVVGLTEEFATDPDLLGLLRSIPAHRRPGKKESPLKNLGTLAHLLEGGDAGGEVILDNAEALATNVLVDALYQEYAENRAEIDGKVDALATTSTSIVNLGDGIGGAGSVSAGDTDERYDNEGMPSAFELHKNFTDAIRVCGSERALRGLWQRLAGSEDIDLDRIDDPDAHVDSQMKAVEVGLRPGIKSMLEEVAEKKFEEWRSRHALTLRSHSPEEFGRLMAGTAAGGDTNPTFPMTFETPSTHEAPEGSIYTDAEGKFYVGTPLNDWETETIKAMKSKFPHFRGWWRNPTGGDKALGVRYEDSSGEKRTTYPDFLGVYVNGEDVTLRLFDPHAEYRDGNSRNRWLGLAKYLRSELNKKADGSRIVDEAYAIIKDDEKRLLALDLGDDSVVEMLKDKNLIDIAADIFGSDKSYRLN